MFLCDHFQELAGGIWLVRQQWKPWLCATYPLRANLCNAETITIILHAFWTVASFPKEPVLRILQVFLRGKKDAEGEDFHSSITVCENCWLKLFPPGLTVVFAYLLIPLSHQYSAKVLEHYSNLVTVWHEDSMKKLLSGVCTGS